VILDPAGWLILLAACAGLVVWRRAVHRAWRSGAVSTDQAAVLISLALPAAIIAYFLAVGTIDPIVIGGAILIGAIAFRVSRTWLRSDEAGRDRER
jgi:hypothetical protein